MVQFTTGVTPSNNIYNSNMAADGKRSNSEIAVSKSHSTQKHTSDDCRTSQKLEYLQT